jgi:hypothetical protein
MTQELPGTGGKIRETLEDFIVEEVPVFKPDGEGEHLFVNMTKRGIGTRRLAHSLASLFSLNRTAVGLTVQLKQDSSGLCGSKGRALGIYPDLKPALRQTLQ